jgi:hypothetical protein
MLEADARSPIGVCRQDGGGAHRLWDWNCCAAEGVAGGPIKLRCKAEIPSASMMELHFQQNVARNAKTTS